MSPNECTRLIRIGTVTVLDKLFPVRVPVTIEPRFFRRSIYAQRFDFVAN